MVREMFQQLTDFILAKNPYLVTGYANVYKDTSSGRIISRNDLSHDEYTVIFPNDRLGTYFYLRNNGLMNFNLEPESILSDCMVGANQFNIPIRMVCVLPINTDPYNLIQNIVSTLSQSQIRMIYTSAEWNPDNVIEIELAGVNREDIEAAKRVGSRFCLMSFSFIVIAPIEFLELNCLQNPCIPC